RRGSDAVAGRYHPAAEDAVERRADLRPVEGDGGDVEVRAGDVALGRRAVDVGCGEAVPALEGVRTPPGLPGEGELRLGLGHARAFLVVAEAEEEHTPLHLL